MSKNLGEAINNIMEENSSKRVLILTDKMHIIGTIHDFANGCKNCTDCIISLKNVRINRLDDMCNCTNDECECNLEAFMEYEWFNINASAIVGFSVL